MNEEKKPRLWFKILVFGDSVAHGSGDTKGGGWADRLKRHFFETYHPPEAWVQVHNLGLGGQTTADLLDRFASDCGRYRDVDVILIGVGVNDSAYFEKEGAVRIGIKKYRENLIRLVGLAREHTDNIVLLGLTPVDDERTNPILWGMEGIHLKNSRVQEYDKCVHDVASEYGAAFVDVAALLIPSQLVDGVHPDSEGHLKIFEKVLEMLQQEYEL